MGRGVVGVTRSCVAVRVVHKSPGRTQHRTRDSVGNTDRILAKSFQKVKYSSFRGTRLALVRLKRLDQVKKLLTNITILSSIASCRIFFVLFSVRSIGRMAYMVDIPPPIPYHIAKPD